MTMTREQLLALAQQSVEVADIDMTETGTSGGFEPLPAGNALARLVQYIELGKHAKEFQGKAKAPTMQIRLGFALWGKGYTNEDGSPKLIRSNDLPLGNNEKNKAKIAFDRMNYLQKAKGFAQLLGQTFILPITQDPNEKTGKIYNNINWAGISAPINPLDGSMYPVPEAPDDLYKLFIWNLPTKETWASLFIEGVNSETKKSKNYIQELCLKAADFPGSALERLLGGGVPDITGSALTVPVVDGPIDAPVVAAPEIAVPAVAQPVIAPVVAPAVATPDIPVVPDLSNIVIPTVS